MKSAEKTKEGLSKTGERTRATTVTKGTEGVHRVVNHLTIGPKV